jgi:hypothetical protein
MFSEAINQITRDPSAWRSADRSRRGKKPDFEMSLAVPSGYAWQYIFAIVAFFN